MRTSNPEYRQFNPPDSIEWEEQVASEKGHPGAIDAFPSEFSITGTPRAVNPEQLRDMADEFLQDKPHITNAIIRYGKDAVALATKRGIMLYVGIGVASLATVAGSVLIWRQLHKKDSSSE